MQLKTAVDVRGALRSGSRRDGHTHAQAPENYLARGAWIELFRKIREDRAQLEENQPKYLYDASDWRPWWLNLEPDEQFNEETEVIFLKEDEENEENEDNE